MPEKTQENKTRAVGRRKKASARIRIEKGKGAVVINGRELNDYFPVKLWQDEVLAPLVAIGREKDFDVFVKVAGGGVRGQAEAIRHGVARSLVAYDETLKPVLKSHGFLSRDDRAKERKKYGLRKARRAHQWKKR